jgi:hypothetical protein
VNCYLALTSIVDLSPQCIADDSVEYEDMSSQLVEELTGLYDSCSQVHKQTPPPKAFVRKFQVRLLLLRSLCMRTQVSKDMCIQMNNLVDRVWSLGLIGDDHFPSCLELLVGVIGGMAGDIVLAKMLCSQRLPRPLSDTMSLQSESLSSRSTSRTDDSRQLNNSSVKKVMQLLLSPMSKGGHPISAVKLSEIKSAAITWRSLVMCNEGRMLLANYLPSVVALLNQLLKAPCIHRQEAVTRTVALLQLLVAASISDQDFQHHVFKTAGFPEFIVAVCDTFLDVEGAPSRVTEASAHSWDITCDPGVTELLCLLIRNLARLRPNKAKFCGISGVFEFLLVCIKSEQMKLIASASSALWAIVHDCERAKSALRSCNAISVIQKALSQLKKRISATQDMLMPSLLRSERHLAMVLELASQV